MPNSESKAYILAKRALTLCLTSALLWVSVESALCVRLYRQQSISVLRNVDSVTHELQSSARAFKTVSELQAAQLTDERVQRSIGLFLRIGDDANRTVKKINHALDLANQALQTVNRDTLPRTTQILDSTDALIVRANQKLIVLDTADEAVKQVVVLLRSPDVQRAIIAMAETSEFARTTSQEIAIASGDIRKSLPQMLESFQALEKNSADATEKVAKILDYVHGIMTRKTTKKEKALRALLYVLIYGVPIASQAFGR